MSFPFYIAKRYLLSKSSNNAINFITIIAAIGVIIGSASLFIVLSGFAGLKDFSLQFSSIVDPDLKAVSAKGKNFTLSQQQLQQLNDLETVASFSKVIEERAVLGYDNKKLIVTLKGVDNNYPKATIDSILFQGQWFEPGTDQIVVGLGISNNLSIGVFDYGQSINIAVPKPGKGQITSVNAAYSSVTAINSGLFQINEDLDYSYVYANLETAAYLLNYKEGQISALEFKLNNIDDIEMAREDINAILGDTAILKTRAQLNDALYKMLNTEEVAVYLIFTLVLIIALFNVIGSIIMMILDKKKNLNTLYNLGITVKDIKRIFFIQGSLMSVVGGAIGLFLGYVVVWLQSQFSLVMITQTLPYPVIVQFKNFIIVFITISVLGIIASKIASYRISKRLITTV